MKKLLWMAFIPLTMASAGAVETDRFSGYTTMVVTTWATRCASALTPVMINTFGYPPFVAQKVSAETCACTIDHWREAMSYAEAMALNWDVRRKKSEQYTLMCAGKSEEL
jgi:hypothetical protein